jgi:hypothetical protein
VAVEELSYLASLGHEYPRESLIKLVHDCDSERLEVQAIHALRNFRGPDLAQLYQKRYLATRSGDALLALADYFEDAGALSFLEAEIGRLEKAGRAMADILKSRLMLLRSSTAIEDIGNVITDTEDLYLGTGHQTAWLLRFVVQEKMSELLPSLRARADSIMAEEAIVHGDDAEDPEYEMIGSYYHETLLAIHALGGDLKDYEVARLKNLGLIGDPLGWLESHDVLK